MRASRTPPGTALTTLPLPTPQEEGELDDLANDFARLRESIAAELRRTGHNTAPAQPPSRGAPVTSQRVAATLGAAKPAVPPPMPAAAPVPPMPPPTKGPTLAGGGAADEEMPSFYSLRESLLGSVQSEGFAAPVREEPSPHTVKINANPGAARVPTSPGGLGASSADAISLTAEVCVWATPRLRRPFPPTPHPRPLLLPLPTLFSSRACARPSRRSSAVPPVRVCVRPSTRPSRSRGPPPM